MIADGAGEDEEKWLAAGAAAFKQNAFYMQRAIVIPLSVSTFFPFVFSSGKIEKFLKFDSNNLKDALKYSAQMLSELRTSKLSPHKYYDLYMRAFDELRKLEIFFMEETRRGCSVIELYELVQHAGNILPRLYLLCTAGSVYIKTKEAPAKEILKDLVEMCRGIQHPLRGLFLRSYLAQISRDKLPDIGSEYEGVLHVLNVIEAQEDMPILSAVTLYSSLLKFTLHVHPDRLDYADQVLGSCIKKLSGKGKIHDTRATKELVTLLSAPLEKYNDVVIALKLTNYPLVLDYLDSENKRVMATVIIRSIMKNKTIIATAEKVEALLELIKGLINDLDEPQGLEVDEDDFEEEQNSVARLIHMLYSDDPEEMFKIISVLKNHFLTGGPKRLKFTIPPLVVSALKLIRRLPEEGDNPFGKEASVSATKIFQFLNQIIEALPSAPSPDLAFRLYLQCAEAANKCDEEPIAYEFFTQAYILYEEEISVSYNSLLSLFPAKIDEDSHPSGVVMVISESQLDIFAIEGSYEKDSQMEGMEFSLDLVLMVRLVVLGMARFPFFVRLGNIVVILKLVLNLGPTDSALDEANLMVEGVMLSDSELLLEDGEEGEEWEHGEIMDFAEEDVLNVGKHEVGDQGDTSAQSIKEAQIEMEGQVDGVGEEANKKKIAQTGDDAAGGAAKKRLAPTFASPRKKLLAKAAAKAGEKGAKKAYTKPNNQLG
ncbi:hypothetical protein F2Q69_00052434 [Brassica cretica]|uniref:Vacuolar protein sorting-associated protein 35 n=1 Tax=Brassica cretica TaxID=69181 RepID=A0A8S9MWZ6_BRACR|nr:hypothetical protein F2Q69_00052434 [Brassica cretica]